MFSRKIGLAALVLGAATTAHAQEYLGAPGAEMWQNGWYVGAGYRWQRDSLSTFDHQVFFRDTNGVFQPAHRIELHVIKHGPNALIGYALPDGTLPAWLGRNVRVDLGGWYVVGDGEGSSFRQGRVTAFRTTRINGITNLVGAGGGGESSRVSVRVTTADWRLNLRAATDFTVREHVLFFSPWVAVMGGQAQSKYSQRYDDTFGQVNALNAKIRSDEIGAQLGGKFTVKATPWLAFNLGGFAGFLHRRAHMNGSDCFSVGGPTVPCNTPPAAIFFTSSVSETRSRTAFVGGGEAGIAFAPGDSWQISLTGSIAYDSAVPSYRGPVAGPTTGSQGTPSGVKFTGEIGYAVMARFALKLW